MGTRSSWRRIFRAGAWARAADGAMNDHIFRLILILGFVMVFPLGAYYRVKSQATRVKLDRLQEVLCVLVSILLLGLAGMSGLLTFLIDPGWMAWSSVPLPVWLRWVGVGLGVLAALLLVWTFRNLGKN